jgi:solute carrier family 35 protein C2
MERTTQKRGGASSRQSSPTKDHDEDLTETPIDNIKMFMHQNETNYLIPTGEEPIQEEIINQSSVSSSGFQSGWLAWGRYLLHKIIPRENFEVKISDQGAIIRPEPHNPTKDKPTTAKIIIAIVAWFLFSTLLSIFNKNTIGKKHYNFEFSFFLTGLHGLFQFMVSYMILYGFRFITIDHKPIAKGRYFKSIVPCGISSGLDIGLATLSFKSITLTFYTMVKSSTPVFVLLCAFVLRLEKPTWMLTGIIGLISLGVFLTVMDDTSFDSFGFFCVLGSSFMSGVRWSLTQMLMQHESLKLKHPLLVLLYISPVISVVQLGLSLSIEGWGRIFASEFFSSVHTTITTIGFLVFGAVLSFLMIVSEFRLLHLTSVVTLSVIGIFKEIVTIVISSVIFGDKLSPVNILGFCITLSGIALYNYTTYKRGKNAQTGSPQRHALMSVEQFGLTDFMDHDYIELEELQELPAPAKLHVEVVE